MEPKEGKMAGTSSPGTVCTKLERIAALARQVRNQALTTLAHHIDRDWLMEAYRRTRKDGARGVDGVAADAYAQNLGGNLEDLLRRMHDGSYVAPLVRRVHIPKDDGKTRPIGIPTFEDKVLQRAVAMVLEAVYEQEFHDCSHGFRPGRSAHGAMDVLYEATRAGGGHVVELDLERFFDTLDRAKLRAMVERRVRDGVLLRLIGKWLKAGVLEDGRVSYPDEGTPQGGVISPLLANIYLHEVLDTWFHDVVRPRLRGRGTLIRYADDAVLVFEREDDARRVLAVLPKRFEKYGLRLHPEKTRLVRFERPRSRTPPPETFDFLGFTLYWGLSRRGRPCVRQKTSSKRFRRALHRIAMWCAHHRHEPMREQQASLARKVQGHYAYYGVTGNSRMLSRFWHAVRRHWRRWLSRRSQRAKITWARFSTLMLHFELPRPRIVHSVFRAANP